ncbi:sigma-54-dependent transcriptional regulator [Sporomusa malonica]|uniref:DNA-binding transcriptional response regulator, NtrC family, contains REC, AAA-type ATPase, and a Fis-type DNA-binding domains n=1 Tax=Sporomusa malonica TaxID=112901 RepID=A0A1W2C645_9FIRM|nr:sigma-54 dependent transcriptional regulator [Sporomusa malonica]SMC80158.1 DNA-binding transcriptional response regulator, NtrC family, contains REC, AAA-type ATPase, and a Fis-type DNA-binding domains [Sporomusa malonica]
MNVLLTDDDNLSREIIAEILRDLGHCVTEATNGKQAFEHFATGSFPMVISDLKMPKMSGLDLLDAIKSASAGQHTDVVLITGFADIKSAVSALRAGAYDYLLKPINVEELIAVTERVAEHQALRQENQILTTNFAEKVQEATAETQEQLYQLKKLVAGSLKVGEVAVFSEKMREVMNLAQKHSLDRSLPVLIQGETGTGKEVIARMIHYGKLNEITPFVDVNCAAITPNLFESEIFGYESGAFTGALSKGQKGKFDLAAGGTLFLDEVGEIPLELQGKLLRVIQEKEYYRVGGLKKLKTDVRLVCATNVELEKKVEQGHFRRDLYHRLRVGFINIPALRSRKEEIIPLAVMFLREYAKQKGKNFKAISHSATQILLGYSWPGNVRELKNAMEWVTFMHDGTEVLPEHLGIINQTETAHPSATIVNPDTFVLPPEGLNIDAFMLSLVEKALVLNGGNKSATASYLGISRKSLYRRLQHTDLSIKY